MKSYHLILALISCALITAGCSEEHSANADPDAATIEDIEEESDAEDSRKCTLILELAEGIILASTWDEAIDAGTRPLICWEIPEGGELPEQQDGWELRVEREENAGGSIDETEWYVLGLHEEALQIGYGDCEGEAQQCTEAAVLAEGTHFVYIIDPGRADGLAGSLVFEVE